MLPLRSLCLSATTLACTVGVVGAHRPVLHGIDAAPPASAAQALPPATDVAILHFLNRFAFGPRQADVARVKAVGLQQYIDDQLHPERIADGMMEPRLARFATLRLSLDEIVDRYERPLLEARRQKRQADTAAASAAVSTVPPQPAPPAAADMLRRPNGPVVDLAEQKLLRAIYSERQLQEVLTDFWFNHFNVDARKGRTRFLLTAYERDAIRPHVLGRFRDLLGAVAHSPAMLFYLDNWLSVDPHGIHPNRGRRQSTVGRRIFEQSLAARPNLPKGLNENYGRELLELHTLGVDGGYTQEDVTEVARVFTGWTIGAPQNRRVPLGFRFDPRMHDEGAKTILGHGIEPGGASEGDLVLDILARHPATARFIATKLARRFVSDTPPPALVDHLAARFMASDGDLRQVMTALVESPEFWSTDAQRAKVKAPFEFVVSAVRAVGLDVPDARPLLQSLQRLGMPLYQCQPPTGYKDVAEAWTSAGALVERMNVAITLATWAERPSTRTSLEMLSALVGTPLSPATKATIARADTTAQAVALTLGSPEFQKR